MEVAVRATGPSQAHRPPRAVPDGERGPEPRRFEVFPHPRATTLVRWKPGGVGRGHRGMENVYRIENCDLKPGDRPYDPQQIISIERI